MEKYKVHQLVRYKGNPIFAGVYNANELPDVIKNNPNLATKVTTDAIATANYQAAIKSQNIYVGAKGGMQGQESFNPKPAVDIDAEDKKKTEENKKKEKVVVSAVVNTSTIDELSAIDGITMATAQDIVVEREKTKFVDFDDLDKRVALKGGRKWASFSDRLKIN